MSDQQAQDTNRIVTLRVILICKKLAIREKSAKNKLNEKVFT